MLSNYHIEVIDNRIVRISHDLIDGTQETRDIYLINVFWGGVIDIPISVEDNMFYTILKISHMSREEFHSTGEYRAKGESKGVFCIYSKNDKDNLHFVMFTSLSQLYARFFEFYKGKSTVRFRRKFLVLDFKAKLETKYFDNKIIEKIELVLDDNHRYKIILPLSSRNDFVRIKKCVSLDSIIEQETSVNNPIHIEVYLNNNVVVSFGVGYLFRENLPPKYNFVPIASKYYRDYALCVRGNLNHNWTLVVRPMEAIEKSVGFKIKESFIVSWLMYHIVGKIKVLNEGPIINLFFEKNAMKADEGTFEIFEKCNENRKTHNYFVLSEDSLQWEELKKRKNVVKKYSWKYYFLLYSAKHYISTETSSHLNVHRAINRYIRKTLMESKLIFLQHGVTYLKCQGAGSVFGKDKEGEPTIVVVGSKKEANIVAKMLDIPIERCLIAGLPVFSTIDFNHICDNSDDIVCIMLTWKVSEEHMLTHFEDSLYYQFVCVIYEVVKQYVTLDRIRIVPHPKVYNHLLNTRLKDYVWKGSVSKALDSTKLLITDYSSACYNAFYQGAGVVFFQPDLEQYEKEVGKLIPQKDEYIGYRVFNIEDFKAVIKKGICDGKILLEYFRNSTYIDNYLSINEFNDGKNVERIVYYLKKERIV